MARNRGFKFDDYDDKQNEEIEKQSDDVVMGIDNVNEDTRYFDDITGEELDPELVCAARQEEIDFFHKKKVYKIVSRAIAFVKTGRAPISVRWVYVDKGDKDNPEIRARLVAREIRHESSDGSMYAATPLSRP